MVVSDLKKLGLKDVLEELKDVTIEYRSLLDSTIPNFTFGTEIEFEKYDYKELFPLFWDKGFRNWKSVYERSISDGGEVVSDILYNKESDWQELKEICHILKEKGVTIGGKSGGHIHVGAQILEGNIDYWLTFLKMWTVFEPVLCKFSHGEKGYARPMMYVEAKPFNNELKKIIYKFGDCRDLSELIYLLKDFKRSRTVNFRNVSWDKSSELEYKNTIEFRLFNGSVDEVIWQNNVNMLLNLFMTIKSGNYDKDFINYHFDKENNINSLDLDIAFPGMVKTNNLDLAISFVDMIYTDELDKLYFLKQYLQREYLEEEKKYVKTI